ncbi:hypothetical protein NDU88_000513 [Pleurodeles waltl]|uniref:Uncharacterized protein n=1 Tax=Pleurodeles waltl TaxID=8319 RepID=A0AAV7UQ80_PLEWA|nr:hypothetical protein NDU88_000513 [Pleurodeles waltl]
MGQTTGIRGTLEKDLLRLEDRLHTLDNEHGGSPEAHCQLQEVREEYSVALKKLRCHDHVGYMRRVHEEEGRAAACLVVWPPHGRDPITGITLADGSLIHDPLRINAVFRDYYLALYAHPETPLPGTLSDLLFRLQLTTLNKEK